MVMFGLNDFWPSSFLVFHSLHDTVLVLAGGLLTRHFCAFYAIQSWQFFKFNPFFLCDPGVRTDEQIGRIIPPKQTGSYDLGKQLHSDLPSFIAIRLSHKHNYSYTREDILSKTKREILVWLLSRCTTESEEICSSCVDGTTSPRLDDNITSATSINTIYKKERPCIIESEALYFFKLYCWIVGIDLSSNFRSLIYRSGVRRITRSSIYTEICCSVFANNLLEYSLVVFLPDH